MNIHAYYRLPCLNQSQVIVPENLYCSHWRKPLKAYSGLDLDPTMANIKICIVFAKTQLY